MQYRQLGKTGLEVSIISQGGAALGDMYGVLEPGVAGRCVREGIDAGINLIDTSPFYGLTRSETVLGEILGEGNLRDRVLLCSKAGRNSASEFDFSAGAMAASVDASLRRLKTDHLDILIAHDIEFADDYEQVFTETAEVLHRLKEQGKMRFVGMSGYPLGILKQAIERCNLDVVISYAHYTLQNTLLVSELLPVAEVHGVGVLNASPLALGLLTKQGPPAWHPASEAILAACRKAADYCAHRRTDIAILGMQFCYAQKAIASTITGTALPDELKLNLSALNYPLDPDVLEAVEAILAPVKDQTWPSGNWQ